MRVLSYDGGTAVVEVYLAPGLFSRNVVQQIIEKFEVMLAEQTTSNAFLKRVSRKRDFYAIIAIESDDFRIVTQVASSIEKKTRKVSLKVKNSIYSALNLL
ncbi:MAG: hypothetical protein GOU98_02730 [Candidatus Altiarchaeota archaeon]|nr:hypothetical protein [Candidatus Altiarchaeota archaeon]